jgi:hypothetical protein
MTECEVDGCAKPQGTRQRLCYMHTMRLRRTGTTDSVRRTWQERYWSKVDKSGDCWLWTGGTSTGYGTLSSAPDKYAHRLGYMLAHDMAPIPAGMCVCHQCDTPRCVNPEHLFLGDIPENQRDMSEKLRSTWGERSALAKLTTEDVHEIRRLLRAGLPQTEIAKRFGVSQPSIGNINTGTTWRHLVSEV